MFGNVGSVVTFRVGTTDAEFLAKQFAPVFDIDDLQFLPNYNTAVRMMIGGVPVQPFSMAILPPLGNPNPHLADALKQLSAAKYGRPKAQVEAEIFKRLETKSLPRPANPYGSPFGQSSLPPGGGFPPTGQSPSGGLPPLSAPAPPKPASSGSSFLDEWLAKRKETIVKPTSMPATPKVAAPATTLKEPVTHKSAEPKENFKLEAAVDKTKPTNTGEFKIDREIDPAKHQSQIVHIDKEGNLSFGE